MRSPRMAGLAKAIVASLLWSASALAVPPPPPPPGWIDFAGELSRTYRQDNLAEYLALFSEDVVLAKDGKEIGIGLAVVRSEYRSDKAVGLHIIPIAVASGGNEVLVLERLDNLPEQFDHQVHDCCFWFRAIRYTVDNRKISRIDVLTAQAASRLEIVKPDP